MRTEGEEGDVKGEPGRREHEGKVNIRKGGARGCKSEPTQRSKKMKDQGAKKCATILAAALAWHLPLHVATINLASTVASKTAEDPWRRSSTLAKTSVQNRWMRSAEFPSCVFPSPPSACVTSRANVRLAWRRASPTLVSARRGRTRQFHQVRIVTFGFASVAARSKCPTQSVPARVDILCNFFTQTLISTRFFLANGNLTHTSSFFCSQLPRSRLHVDC